MVFIKHKFLKLDIHFNPVFTPCFIGSKFLRVRRFFRVQVILGQDFSGSRFSGSKFFRVRVQGPGPGFRSSHFELLYPVDTRTKNVPTKDVHKGTFIFGSIWKHEKTSKSERLMNVPMWYV